MKKLALLFSTSMLLIYSYGQSYNMSDGEIITCSGNFYDSGGPSLNYESNEDFLLTFSPENEGSFLEFNFVSFELKNPGDILYIYDGPGTDAPMIGGYHHKESPGLITAENTGDLTFHFISLNHNKTKSGWQANISCVEGQQSNNTCDLASSINEVTGHLFSTVNASASGKHPGCGGGQAPTDLWYQYSATATGLAAFNLCGNDFKPRLAIWESCTTESPIDCNTATGNDPCTMINKWVTEGEIIYIQAGGKNATTGVGELSISLTEPYWTGSISTDWNDPLNWFEGFIPTGTSNVTIPANPMGDFFPETNSGEGAVCKDLTIESGAHMYVPADNSLTVHGVLVNNAGTNGLIIQANETGMGSLIHDSPEVEATVQQYLISDRNHMVSSPVNNSTLEPYAGIFFYQFDESNNNWINIEESSTPMMVTKGYRVWASDDFTGSTTVSLQGPLNNGDYNVSTLSYTPGSPTEGWNLVGNPYPSALQWNDLWTKTEMSEWACVENNGTQECYNAATGEMWPDDGGIYMSDGIIPSTQGFWVRAISDEASFSIPQSERFHSDQPFYKDAAIEIEQSISVEVKGISETDVAKIQFHEMATEGYDPVFDLDKFLKNENAPQLYTYAEKDAYAVNVLPNFMEERVVPMGFEANETGIFSISLSEIVGFNNELSLYLEDKKDKSLTLLSEMEYAFHANPADQKDRFILHFMSDDPTQENHTTSNKIIYSYKNHVYVHQPRNFSGIISIYNIMGQEVWSTEGTGQGLMRINIDERAGFFLVKIQHNGQVITKNVFIQ